MFRCSSQPPFVPFECKSKGKRSPKFGQLSPLFMYQISFHSEADLNDLGSSYSLSFDSFKKPAASQLWTGWQCSQALRRLLRLTLIRRSEGLKNTLQLCEGGLSPVHLCCQAPGPETRHLRSFIQAQATILFLRLPDK